MTSGQYAKEFIEIHLIDDYTILKKKELLNYITNIVKKAYSENKEDWKYGDLYDRLDIIDEYWGNKDYSFLLKNKIISELTESKNLNKLLQLLEHKTGKKVILKERGLFSSNKDKEATGTFGPERQVPTQTGNKIVDGLQKLLFHLTAGLDIVNEPKFVKNPAMIRTLQMVLDKAQKINNGLIQKATKSDELQEDLEISMDQIQKKPTILKDLEDKIDDDTDIKLTDENDNEIDFQ